MKLTDLKIGQKAKIISIDSSNLPTRFFELGFIPNSFVQIMNIAVLGGPIHLSLDENQFAIRRTDASKILVELIN